MSRCRARAPSIPREASWTAAALATALLLGGSPAWAAAEDTQLSLVALGCGLSRGELERAVRAELRAAARPSPGALEVRVVCSAGRAQITTRVGAGDEEERALSVSGSGDVRLRVLSLAIAEALWAASDERAQRSASPHSEAASAATSEPGTEAPEGAASSAAQSAEERPRADTPPPVKRAAVGRSKRILRPWSRLLALGSSRAFFSSPGALYGGGVRYGSDRSRYVSWSADSLYERGVIRRELQAIEIDTFTLGGNVSFARRWGFSTWRIGTALRLGLAHSATGPRGASSSTDAIVPWGWPSAQVSASFRFGAWVVDASGDLGYTVVPLAAGASGTRDTAIRGTWFGAQLGIGHAFFAKPAL